MSFIGYANVRAQIADILQATICLCAKDHRKPNPAWQASLAEQLTNLKTKALLRIVLIGEFSAGKSSLIAALTGNDVPIGADVTTTETKQYPWKGVVLVDTPGIQSQASHVDHDRIAQEATIGADLVLFVITNELLNDRLAAHLQYVIGDSGLRLANKTAIIVNKMDRETNPDEVICSEVCKVLGNYSDLPVWFCAAGKYLQSAQMTGSIRDRFRSESRMEELAEHIDAFVGDRGAYGQLITPLQVIEDVLSEAEAALAEGADLKNEIELLRRQKRILAYLRTQIMSLKCVYKQKVQAAVMKRADSALKGLSETTTSEALEMQIEQGLLEATRDVEPLVDELAAELTAALDHTRDELEELGNSPLAQSVLECERRKVARPQMDLDVSAPKNGPTTAMLMRQLMPTIKDSLKAAAKDTKAIRDTIYTIGKTFGKKFRPWQATTTARDLAKGATKLGKILPFVAVAIDAYINYREEKAEDEKRTYVASLRLAARRAFLEHASLEAKAILQSVDKFTDSTIHPAMRQIDERGAAIGASRDTDAAVSSRICELKALCGALWSKIERKALSR